MMISLSPWPLAGLQPLQSSRRRHRSQSCFSGYPAWKPQISQRSPCSGRRGRQTFFSLGTSVSLQPGKSPRGLRRPPSVSQNSLLARAFAPIAPAAPVLIPVMWLPSKIPIGAPVAASMTMIVPINAGRPLSALSPNQETTFQAKDVAALKPAGFDVHVGQPPGSNS